MIDTNVLAELRKADRANAGVRSWFEGLASEDTYLSVLTVGEIQHGVELIRRRDPQSAQILSKWLNRLMQDISPGHMLPVTHAIAWRWGGMGVPDPVPVVDGLLAATAIEHQLTLVTRNVRDVERTGVNWLNPFSE